MNSDRANGTVIREFLDQHGEGIHHIAFECNNAPWEQRLKMFADRGFTAGIPGDQRRQLHAVGDGAQRPNVV